MRILLLLVLLFSFGSSQSFEGVMTFRATGRSVQEFTYSTKGDNVRMDLEPSPGGKMAMLIDTRANSVTIVRNDAKVYFDMNMDQMTPPSDASRAEVSVTKTGKKEMILGYDCEEMLINQEDRSAELWVTKGLGRFVQVHLNPRAQSPMLKKLEEELIDQGYFPLRLVTKNLAGNEETRMEVLKIEKRSLSDELFAVPAGYQKMQMPPPPKQ